MNTFTNLDNMWHHCVNTLLTKGAELPSRDGPTREVLGFVGRLEDPRANFLFNPVRKINPSYAAAELIWYMSGQRTVDALLPYAPQYKRFCNERVLTVNDENQEDIFGQSTTGYRRRPKMYAHGAYGFRIMRNQGEYNPGMSQMESIIHIIRKDPTSRQAVMTMYDVGMDQEKATIGDRIDIPCTLSLNFILRDGKLNCAATMRSNDVWLGLPHDVYAFTSIQMIIADALEVDVGWYQHSAMSLHLYDRNYQAAMQAIAEPRCGASIAYTTPLLDWVTSAAVAVAFERSNRKSGSFHIPTEIGVDSVLGQAVVMAGLKWNENKLRVSSCLSDSPLKSYMEKHWC